MNKVKVKAKVKVLKTEIAGDDEDLGELFNNMVGTANMNFAYPRYRRIHSLIDRIAKLLRQFATSPTKIEVGAEYSAGFAEMGKFADTLDTECARMFSVRLESFSFDYNAVDEELKQQFLESYENMRKSRLIADLVKICNDLHVYRDYIDPEKPSADFVLNMAGCDFSPFPFNFNIKQLVSIIAGRDNGTHESEEICAGHLQLVIVYLGLIYARAKDIWTELQQPDADVKKFIDVLMSGLSKISNSPEFSRCGKAFAALRNSVGMLESRFSDYYRDFIQSGNKNIIMEHFVLDVAKESGRSDPELMRQFNVIISQYRKKLDMAGALDDPRLNKAIDKLMGIFCANDENASNLLAKDNGGDSEDEIAPRSKYDLMSAGGSK